MLKTKNNRWIRGVSWLAAILVLSALNSGRPVCAQAAVQESSGAAKVKASSRVETYRFVYDPSGKGSMESGLVTTLNADKLLYRGFNYAADAAGIHEHWYSRPLTIPLLIMFLPNPIEYMHEYYGHGAFLREFGFNDYRCRYSWSILSTADDAYCRSDSFNMSSGNYEQAQLSLMAGPITGEVYLLEAEKEMYRSGRATLHLARSVQIAASNEGGLEDGFSDPNKTMSDSASWVKIFKEHYNNDSALAATYADKAKKAVERADTLDPAKYWAAVTFLHYLWTGSDSLYAPMVPLAGVKFGFSPRVNIMPLGPENYYYLFASRNGMLASAYYRTGESPEGDVSGYGVELGPIKIGGIELTPACDYWSLPSSPELKYSKTGYNAQLKLDIPAYKAISITGKTAYKTKGYMMGLPSHSGFYGYAGATLTF